MKIKVLASGSKGNSTYIETKKSKILIDIGITYPHLLSELSTINRTPQDLDAILITHTHSDHIKGLQSLVKKTNISVYASPAMLEELKEKRSKKNEKLAEQEEEITNKFKIIEDLKSQIVKIDVKKTKLEEDINGIINKMWEEYELTPNNVVDYRKPDNVQLTQKKVKDLRNEIRELGSVNIDSIEEYKNLKDRYDFMCEQRVDLESTMAKLRKIISDMTNIMKEQFKEKFEMINKNFAEVFKE